MGTRNLTHIRDTEGTLVTLYRQYDGYPSGWGVMLAEFLQDFVVVNGIRVGDDRKIANGIGCLAAQIIANFKDGAGGMYVHPVDSEDCGEEYVYVVYHDEAGQIIITIYEGPWNEENEKEIFSGTPQELLVEYKK